MEPIACPVCYNSFDHAEPWVLNCGHSICACCCLTIRTDNKPCPICRDPCVINGYRKNFDLITSIKKCKEAVEAAVKTGNEKVKNYQKKL